METFIDYENVEHENYPPLESVMKFLFYQRLNFDKSPLFRMSLVEHRVSLMDHIFQLFASAKEFSYLTFEKHPLFEIDDMRDPEISVCTFIFDLSLRVKLESR